jgi:glutaredoxin 3
LCYY